MRSNRLPSVACIVLCLVSSACGSSEPSDDGGDGAVQCLAPLDLDCDPTYPATFDQIYDRTISKSCGVTGAGMSCHGDEGGQLGLVLSGEDQAYDALLGKLDVHALVVPGEPECSILVQRVESNDAAFRMPSGETRLSEGVRCAIRQWIANGAERR